MFFWREEILILLDLRFKFCVIVSKIFFRFEFLVWFFCKFFKMVLVRFKLMEVFIKFVFMLILMIAFFIWWILLLMCWVMYFIISLGKMIWLSWYFCLMMESLVFKLGGMILVVIFYLKRDFKWFFKLVMFLGDWFEINMICLLLVCNLLKVWKNSSFSLGFFCKNWVLFNKKKL